MSSGLLSFPKQCSLEFTFAEQTGQLLYIKLLSCLFRYFITHIHCTVVERAIEAGTVGTAPAPKETKQSKVVKWSCEEVKNWLNENNLKKFVQNLLHILLIHAFKQYLGL